VADVTILELDLERTVPDITLHTAHTLYSNEAHLLECCRRWTCSVGAGAGARSQGAQADYPRMLRRIAGS